MLRINLIQNGNMFLRRKQKLHSTTVSRQCILWQFLWLQSSFFILTVLAVKPCY